MRPITVILPVYNGMKFLELSIISVLKQSFTDFELLIIDDCSIDGSREYLNNIQDDRVKIFLNKENRGLFYNLNYLIKQSDSLLIKLWAQDDIMYPDCLEEIVLFHTQHPEIGFSYSGCNYIDGENKAELYNKIDTTPAIISQKLHTRIAFFTGSIAGNIANVTISKKALDKVGLFNEDMKISGDFEMWVRLAKEYPVGFIKKPLIQLRNHKGQLSKQSQYYIHHVKEDIAVYNFLLTYINEDQKKEGWLLLRNHKLLFYYTLMVKAFVKGEWKVARNFLKILHSFDNIFVLSWYFFRNRIIYRNRKRQFHIDNTEFIITNS
jgi:glycosyltransferase involved in cell wall biosynthesis